MKPTNVLILCICFLMLSCQEKLKNVSISESSAENEWTLERLNKRSLLQQDSTKWDIVQLNKDIDNYKNYPEILQSYPLNNAPFPVTEYEYAVSNTPFEFIDNETLYKGIRIGEYENFDSDKIIDKLTLILVTKEKDVEETTFVVSRNYPYSTAQGYFKTSNNTFDWVFSASPDGFSSLMLNMKLFDLRFGETILIYPQADQSFFYKQILDSPNNYYNFEAFKTVILTGNNSNI